MECEKDFPHLSALGSSDSNEGHRLFNGIHLEMEPHALPVDEEAGETNEGVITPVDGLTVLASAALATSMFPQSPSIEDLDPMHFNNFYLQPPFRSTDINTEGSILRFILDETKPVKLDNCNENEEVADESTEGVISPVTNDGLVLLATVALTANIFSQLPSKYVEKIGTMECDQNYPSSPSRTTSLIPEVEFSKLMGPETQHDIRPVGLAGSDINEILTNARAFGLPDPPTSIKIALLKEGASITWAPPIGDWEAIIAYVINLEVQGTSSLLYGLICVYLGMEPRAVIPYTVFKKAGIDITSTPVVMFRIAAGNYHGFGPVTRVRWLVDTPHGGKKKSSLHLSDSPSSVKKDHLI